MDCHLTSSLGLWATAFLGWFWQSTRNIMLSVNCGLSKNRMYPRIAWLIINFTILQWQFSEVSPHRRTNPNGWYLDQTHYIPVVATQEKEDRKINCHSHYSRKILLFYLFGCCYIVIVAICSYCIFHRLTRW